MHHHNKEQYKKGDLIKLPYYGLGLIVEEEEAEADSIIEEDIWGVYWFKYRMISRLYKKAVVLGDTLLKKVINERK